MAVTKFKKRKSTKNSKKKSCTKGNGEEGFIKQQKSFMEEKVRGNKYEWGRFLDGEKSNTISGFFATFYKNHIEFYRDRVADLERDAGMDKYGDLFKPENQPLVSDGYKKSLLSVTLAA